MDNKFVPSQWEDIIYTFWEKKGYLSTSKGKPYTILMPPPNANASLHAGHGMYVIDDILIRYKRLVGYASLWIPGTDHAGFETQYVYEKELSKKGKSRLDYDRHTLFNNIFTFVKENSGLIYKQFKRLGFLADWERSIFMLDDNVIEKVYETFVRLEKENLVYRDDYIVNYCTYCGTSLAELEVKHIERNDPLYYIHYGPFVLATIRPETKFGDTALAVHPQDKRYNSWIGKEVEIDGLLGKFKLKVIADEYVDREFGTGVVKITPAHDPNDFTIGRKHNLEVKKVIGLDGRLNDLTGPYKGLKVKQARAKVLEDLESKRLIEKIDKDYIHSVSVCYKCMRDLEPMVIPNWFLKVDLLRKRASQAVIKNKIKFTPKKYKKQLLDWFEIMHDWPISRQIAWGIQIPIWYEINKKTAQIIWVNWIDKKSSFHQGYISQFFDAKISLDDISKGIQKIIVPANNKDITYIISKNKPQGDFLPETDTFDTWFSSSQWPLVTLKEEEYKERYPTDFMGTYADILKFWISRMIMFSVYLADEVPFKNVYLWSMVADKKGVKMSKSKGNVVNPIDMVEKYGADAFRASLLFGISQTGIVVLSEDKVRAMRNFANKVWNIGRFIKMNLQIQSSNVKSQNQNSKIKTIKQLEKEFEELRKKTVTNMEKYKFSRAFDDLYEFIWHRLADYYIEALKQDVIDGNNQTIKCLKHVYFNCLILLHPFMPFVTEVIWQQFHGKEASILNEKLKNEK